MHAVVRLWELPILLLALDAQMLMAQEESMEHAKNNPVMQNAEFNIQKRDTTQTLIKTTQRPLPKFDLPEFVITGTASIDLPKVEKIIPDDSIVVPQAMFPSSEPVLRDRETLELNMKNRERESRGQATHYTGYAKAGIGTYFSPQAELQFGQSFPECYYSFGGNYFLTKGYAPNTDYSSGGVTASGGSTLVTTMPGLRNTALHGDIGYQSESYRFYGSATPNLQRTLSDFQFQAGVENKIANYLPCAAGISLASFNGADSSASIHETRFDLNYETSIPVSSLPVLSKFHFMMATGGLRYLDVSAGAQNYWETGMLVEGSLHLYWVKGMAGQNLVHLSPQIMASYRITSQHLFYISFEQMFIPMTLASNIIANRYLSAASTIKHQYNTGMGEFGVESRWTEEVQSRVSLNVKSARDLPMFSDSSVQGLWTLAYGGQTRIVTFCAEMVAKLNSNDYFASNILLRSMNDSFSGGKIPYIPAVEIWCSAIHKFGTTVAVSADARFTGERTTDLAGTVSLSKYAVVDVRCEYSPVDYLKLSAGIKNLTDTHFEVWHGYQEFPLTMQLDAQIKW